MTNNKKIAVVIPAYNESGNLKVMVDSLHQVFSTLNYEYKLVFVDDGSKDSTLSILKKFSEKDDKLFYIELSKNFGHQNALKAGVDIVVDSVNAIITMDGDMQYPPELLPQLLAKWEEGFDVVYTIREEDENLSLFKKKTSRGFYSLMNYLSEVKFEPGTADFRLMDQRVAKVFSGFSENELFIRGLINWLGFRQYGISFQPAKRFAGQSKYTVKKMFRFALQGITSFSTRPLYLAVLLGLFVTLASFIGYLFYILFSIYHGHVISGWASLISTVVFFGGLNLIVLGIIGIYVGKLFMQSKGRPNYLIRDTNYKN
ncbi:glycosyltransferase family 2 protein [Flavobacterium covae]|uniref:glycosyltransferase family 2 protein n=1 Tax=Flavobacterium covae TaxID=2906076 RepID=UPI000745CA29|nr:glycosyltransferase family 2 protein [Flavobacterium covae]AMA49325.1 glycosyl transferase family 2 [Flavobacterium covae]MCJ1809248.1 glycosyltransferase family 2 protein [Flavobacterium covae]